MAADHFALLRQMDCADGLWQIGLLGLMVGAIVGVLACYCIKNWD